MSDQTPAIGAVQLIAESHPYPIVEHHQTRVARGIRFRVPPNLNGAQWARFRVSGCGRSASGKIIEQFLPDSS